VTRSSFTANYVGREVKTVCKSIYLWLAHPMEGNREQINKKEKSLKALDYHFSGGKRRTSLGYRSQFYLSPRAK